MRAALLLLLFLLAGCDKHAVLVGCGDDLVRTERDPRSGLAAFHYVRDCGATADYSTIVAIGPADGGMEGATPVFTADADHGAAESDGRGIWLEMHWTGPRRLSIAHAQKARVFEKRERAENAEIVYRATGRMTSPPVD